MLVVLPRRIGLRPGNSVLGQDAVPGLRHHIPRFEHLEAVSTRPIRAFGNIKRT